MRFVDPAECDTRVEKAVSDMFDVEQVAPGMFGVYSYSSDTRYVVDVLEGRCPCQDRAPLCKHYFRVVFMHPAMIEAIMADVDPSVLSREPEGGEERVETDGGLITEGELPAQTSTAASRMSGVEAPTSVDEGPRAADDPDPDCPACLPEIACTDCAGLDGGD